MCWEVLGARKAPQDFPSAGGSIIAPSAGWSGSGRWPDCLREARHLCCRWGGQGDCGMIAPSVGAGGGWVGGCATAAARKAIAARALQFCFAAPTRRPASRRCLCPTAPASPSAAFAVLSPPSPPLSARPPDHRPPDRQTGPPERQMPGRLTAKLLDCHTARLLDCQTTRPPFRQTLDRQSARPPDRLRQTARPPDRQTARPPVRRTWTRTRARTWWTWTSTRARTRTGRGRGQVPGRGR